MRFEIIHKERNSRGSRIKYSSEMQKHWRTEVAYFTALGCFCLFTISERGRQNKESGVGEGGGGGSSVVNAKR